MKHRALREVLPFIFTGVIFGGVVRIQTNGGSGQGWMFLDVDGRCKVITPAHVITVLDGRIVSAVHIVDSKNHAFDRMFPRVLSDASNLDLGLLNVDGANDPAECGSGRLSAIGVARRVANGNQAILETTSSDAIVRVPVRIRSAIIDNAEGSQFTVQPLLAGDRIAEGWSGSVVMDDEGPLGMVTNVDAERNEAIALRTDVIRRLVDGARPPSSAQPGNQPGSPPAVILTNGSVADVNSSSVDLFASNGRGWNIEPKDHRIVFVVSFPEASRLRRVSLKFASSMNAVVAMEIAIGDSPNSRAWDSLRYCLSDKASDSVACSILASSAKNIRLTLQALTNEPIVLSGLAIE